MTVPPELTGPFALLIAALIAVFVLWRDHVKTTADRIMDLRAQRDVAIDGWRAQTDATRQVAEAARGIKEELERERAGRPKRT